MRNFIPWFHPRGAGGDDSSKKHSAGHARQARRRGLQLESLEGREMLTVAVTPVYDVTNAWTSGFQAALRLESHETANVNAWRLEFDLAANITSIWDAKIQSHTGNHYVIVGPAWAANLPAGGAVSFGFVAGSSGSPATPTGYLLNGEALGNSTPAPPPTLSIGDVSLNEGNSGTTNATFTVNLSRAATTPITVRYASVNGTAQAGSDFLAVTNTLTFAAGQTSKAITIPIRGDTTVESDEAFYVDLAAASGATLVKARGTGTIKNDDAVTPPTPGGNFEFVVSSNWGTGFTAQLTMRNTATTPLNNWVVEFDFAGAITSIWDAKVVSRTGNHYVIQNADYNSTIAAGGTMAFGFNGSPGGTIVAPTNYVLRSVAGGGGGGNTNQAPVAGADFASTTPGQAVTINVLANDSDPNGDALTVVSVSSAAHGVAALNADATVRYTPTAGYVGTDTFTYQLRDARGLTATGTVTVNIANAPVPGVWPTQVYAPYVDMTLYPIYDLVAAARTQGLRYFTLAFITADPSNRPAWGGFAAYGLGTDYDAALKTQINTLRGMGGDVIVSFGGAANREMAEVITNVPALQAAYQSIIDAYGLTHIDFDIEGAAAADRTSVDRRNQAIAGLQRAATAAGRALEVSYTLPVLPTGLTADGLYILQSAKNYGVELSNVNVMAMDYGDSAAPNPAGKMGDYAILAATSLFNQLKTLHGATKTDTQLWHMVGVTPMIGLNDVTTETFDQQEARELVAFAQQKGIGRLAMWSLNRDQQNPAGQLGYVDLKSSSVLQSPFEFSQIFNTITR